MDYTTRTEIMQAVKTAVGQLIDKTDERWLSGRELCEQFQCFTPSWLKKYGELLPRVQATVTGPDGSAHKTGWVYPRNKLQEMMHSGKMDFVLTERSEHRRQRRQTGNSL